MKNVIVGGVVGIAALIGAMPTVGQVQSIQSINIAGCGRATEVTGMVVVASTFNKDALAFTDTGVPVKLRNVVYTYNLPPDSKRIQYHLPKSLTLDGLEIGGRRLDLTTNAFEGPYIHMRRSRYDAQLMAQPAIVYLTLPSGTNPVQCRLILTDTHLSLLGGSTDTKKERRPGEQQGGGYSPPTARPSKPTP